MDTPTVRSAFPGPLAFTGPAGYALAPARRSLGGLAPLVVAGCLLCLSLVAPCADEWNYTVKPGDTLWDLSERYLSDPSLLPKLQQLNGIADPYRMLPGTRLRVPLAWLKSTSAAASFIAVHGEVWIEPVASGPRREAVAGATVQAGEVVHTQADGHATVEFFDGSVLTLHPDSVLRLDILRAYAAGLSGVRVELAPGRAETRARPGEASRFEIDTPAGVTSVRGTDFRVSVPPDQKIARTEVLEGEVVVTAAGRDVTVPAGYGTVARAGEPPAAPFALLPPPDLTGLPAQVLGLPVEIEFPAIPGAVAYRSQMARGAVFEQVVFEAVSDLPRIPLPELPNAQYVLRVRAVDVSGLEGRHAQRLVELAVRPAVPSLLEPLDGAQISAAPLHFRWSSASPALVYRFQLARDAAFSEPVEEVPASRDSDVMLERALPPGVYFWRVAASHPEQGDSEFSPARMLRRLPLAPGPLTPAVDPWVLELRWQEGPADYQYDLELARDESFSDLATRARTGQALLRIPRPPAGRYYVRLRAVDADGYASDYAPMQVVDVRSRPPAPHLAVPEDGAVVSGAAARLAWHAQPGLARYHVQLAADARFAQVVIDQRGVEGTSLTIGQSLAPGVYLWRVATITESDGEGAFSDARRLRVLPPAARKPAVPPAQSGSWLLPLLPFLFRP